jgi:hypothetical protein
METFIFCLSGHSEFILELFYCTKFRKYTYIRPPPSKRWKDTTGCSKECWSGMHNGCDKQFSQRTGEVVGSFG